MASILSGAVAGVNQGLSNLVASKRANRQMARDQRRYENEVLFRLGSAKSEQAHRTKLFNYQKSRDEERDAQWEKEMGFREAGLAETVRSNQAREEDVDTDRTLRASMHDDEMTHKGNVFTESKRQFTENQEMERDRFVEGKRQFRITTDLDKQKQIDAAEDRRLSRQLTQNRDATMANYYDEQIRLKEEELNRPLTELEKRQIEADIRASDARSGYYNRMPGSGSSRDSSPKPTWMQTNTLASSLSADLAKRFGDRGASFTWNPVGADLRGRLTREKILPFAQSTPLPYDEASGGEPGQPTQISEMQTFGAEALNRLWRQTGDIELALEQLDSIYDAILLDPDNGNTVRNYMQQYGPENAEQELRQYFLQGGLAAASQLRNMQSTSPGNPETTPTSPSEQIPIGPRF